MSYFGSDAELADLKDEVKVLKAKQQAVLIYVQAKLDDWHATDVNVVLHAVKDILEGDL